MHILIVNPFGIGDVLFTTPLIHTLKEAFPDHRLGFMCNKRSAPLLKNNPYIDEVIIYERDDFEELRAQSGWKWAKAFTAFIHTIKKGKFDAAIDLSLSPQFGFFLMLAGVKKRIGYNYKNRGYFLTHSRKLSGYDATHIVEYYCQLLELLDIKQKYKELELYLDNADEAYVEKFIVDNQLNGKKTIVVSPGGGASWGIEAKIKRWPEEKFALLVNKIIEKYKVTIIILGDLKEKDLLSNLETGLKDKVINLTGKTTLTQSAAIIGRADLFIGNDGGLLHIASALKKKTISFFGPVDPKVYGPYPTDAARHIVLRKTLECSPCYRKFRISPCQRNRECLERIDVDEAIEAVGKLLTQQENHLRR